MASITDVAKLAGVSVSTVSLVCNNKGYVSDATREKVTRAAQELGYTPSQLGRNLKLQRSGIIGVIVPDIAHPFFAEFIKCVEQELQAKGYKTMVCGAAGRESVEQGYLDMLEQQSMDALIMGAHSLDISRYLGVSKPLVALDRYLSDEIPTIRADKNQIARMAADLFLERGRRRVVQLVSSKTIRDFDDVKEAAFRHNLEVAGAEVIDIPVGYNCFGFEQYLDVARRVFAEVPDVDGILGVDLGILACMQEAARLGRMVPEDVSMVAIDGTYVTRIGERTVTAIVQPIDAFAQCAADTVVDLVEHRPAKDWEKPSPETGETVFEVTLQRGETV